MVDFLTSVSLTALRGPGDWSGSPGVSTSSITYGVQYFIWSRVFNDGWLAESTRGKAFIWNLKVYLFPGGEELML